jgi:hypothetical protein
MDKQKTTQHLKTEKEAAPEKEQVHQLTLSTSTMT